MKEEKLLRPRQSVQKTNDCFLYKGIELNFKTGQVTRRGENVHLYWAEVAALTTLMENSDSTFTLTELYHLSRGFRTMDNYDPRHTMSTTLYRLRIRLGKPHYIHLYNPGTPGHCFFGFGDVLPSYQLKRPRTYNVIPSELHITV